MNAMVPLLLGDYRAYLRFDKVKNCYRMTFLGRAPLDTPITDAQACEVLRELGAEHAARILPECYR